MNVISTFYEINYLAVLAAGIAHIALSLTWFNSRLFGKQWTILTNQELRPAKEWIPAGITSHIVNVLILAAVINLANATTALEGMTIATILWVGFIVTLETGELVWEKIPFKLFLIRIGNHFIALNISGIILALWR